jgi:hypothetical protein
MHLHRRKPCMQAVHAAPHAERAAAVQARQHGLLTPRAVFGGLDGCDGAW